MTPDLVDVAVIKRFALIRVLRRYPFLRAAATTRFKELVQIHKKLERRRTKASGDELKALDHKIESFERAIKRLEKDEPT